jgi:predicted ATPase/DNA-binding winged helix-turn-helix (wHTH) protein
MLAEGIRPIYASGGCEIDLARRELRVLGSPVPVGARAFEIIEVLAQSAGELVTKDELMNRVWPGAIVMENTLQVHAAAVRKALGPYRSLLKTESRRGYRLLGEWTVRHRDAAKPPVGLRQTPVTGESAATNFPATVTRLVGRSAAVQRLQDLVSAYRIVTLTGPGGIGKTALALEIARRVLGEFADGGWLAELASLSDPDLVPSAVAGALGLRLGSNTISPEAVARAIAEKKLLLVLDNCEHVIDAAATLAEVFLRLCPGATILATSREVLRIEGEYAYRVPPLEVPPREQVDADQILGHSAPELFVARAKELGSDFSSHTESLPTIAAICRQLDGIPLAIEFAAARAAILGIEQVAAALRDRFALLTSGRRTALPRHRTLRATFDWSYQLLPAGEQLLLNWLSVFPSGFSLAAAIEILVGRQTRSSVIDGVSGLVEKSLLNKDETAAVVAYRMLETTREYAYKRLSESGEAHTAAQRHALYVRNAIVRTEPESAVSRVEAESPNSDGTPRTEEIHNVRSALDWCFSPGGDVGIGLEITAAYTRAWLYMSLMTECRARVETALGRLDQTSALTSEQIMQLYIALSIAVVHTTGLVEDTQASLEKALEIADSSADDTARLRALWAIWDYHSNSREYTRALHTARKFHQMATRSGDRSAIVSANRLLGHSLHYHGEQATARLHLEQVLKLQTEHDPARTVWFQYDPNTRVLTRAILARVLWLLGHPDKAAATAEACCAEAAELGYGFSQCYAHAIAAFPLACLIGNVAAAQQALDACIRVATENHLSFYQSWSQCLRGALLVEQGDFSAGIAVLSGALPVLGRVASRQPEFQIALAKGLAGTGDLTRALDVLGAALTHAKSDGEYWCVPELLRIRSEILITQDQDGSDAAERQLRYALRLARKQGARSWELRAATSLAQYLKSRGDPRHESRRILESVVEQFTEGFATADLLTAKKWLANHR